VFLEKFTIELKVQMTLNKSIAQELDINFSEPDMLLKLVLGSMTASNEFLSIELEEEQLEALFHISTFFNAFSNFSQGVTRELFLSAGCAEFS